MKKMEIRKLVMIAMFCALSFVMVLLGRIIPDVAGFLSYDPKDAMVVIAGFIFGPLASVVISVVVSFIEMISISSTGIYGFLMNVISTCAFAVPAALVYKKIHTIKGAVLGLATGVLFMTGCMVLWNYIITPLYMNTAREVVAGMLATVFLPFNFVKGGINMGLTMLIYKPIIEILRESGMLPRQREGVSKWSVQIGYSIASFLVLIVFVLLFLFFVK